MKKYMKLSLAVSTIILGGSLMSFSASAQTANMPGSSTNPVTEMPEPNPITQQEKTGHVSAEKVKNFDDGCAGTANNGGKVHTKSKTKCGKGGRSMHNNNMKPTASSTGY